MIARRGLLLGRPTKQAAEESKDEPLEPKRSKDPRRVAAAKRAWETMRRTGTTPKRNGRPKKSSPETKLRLIAGLSEGAQLMLISEDWTNIGRIHSPTRKVQLTAVLKDIRAVDLIRGKADDLVERFVAAEKSAQQVTETDTTKAKALSQFYTKPQMANWCVTQLMRHLPANIDYNFIEPSAGHGAFMDAATPYGKVIGFDIDPKRADITQVDFLSLDIRQHLPCDWKASNCVMIGNPPFGNKGDLALHFLNEAFSFADTVAFILPKSFRLFGMQSKVIKGMRLIADLELPDNKYVHCGRSTRVGCTFQIWTRLPIGTDMREQSKPARAHPDFEMARSGTPSRNAKLMQQRWDFAVPRRGNGSFQLIEEDMSSLSDKTPWMFFRCSCANVRARLRSINFKKLAEQYAVAAGWFGYAEIVRAYETILKNQFANDNFRLDTA